MIFTTLTDNGNATEEGRNRHASYAFAAHGTWGGGTLKLQGRVRSSSTWFDITDAEWTDDVSGIVDGSVHWELRFDLSGATAPSLEVSLQPLH